jgi:hypothetical protein
MAKNDVVLLDGILEQRKEAGVPSSDIGEVFELFAFEELLKDFDLTTDELQSGWLDGRDDGGIDGFYIFVNGHLLEDASDFSWPKSHASIVVWLVDCKHHATFQQAPLDLMFATIHELFDLSIADDGLKGSYSEELLAARNLFAVAYKKLSIGRPVVEFNIAYASRGDSDDLGQSVRARAEQIRDEFAQLFSSCTAAFHFIGASELISFHRKTRSFSLDLPFLEHLATGKDSYVLLVRLDDYWKFVSDASGSLRRYLFDSNVRDFLGGNQVNEEIARSLADPTAPDFWWLNNGVTLLATAATVPGKTIQLQDIQIVNGLQTTETIFHHFATGNRVSSDRALLVKIIVSSDALARDQIIRATNNQSPVEVAALRATDKIQRDIEDILFTNDLYYERRKNYHRNIGKPLAHFITPVYLASAVVALVFKHPSRASNLKSKFMRDQLGYESVFSEAFPLGVWVAVSNVFKATDAALNQLASKHFGGERFIARWRSLVALIAVAKRLGKFDYSINELVSLDPPLESMEIEVAWNLVLDVSGDNIRRGKPSPSAVLNSCAEASKRFLLSGFEVVGKRDIPSQPLLSSPTPFRSKANAPPATQAPLPMDPLFVDSVDALLPRQPWQPGIHALVAKQLGCSPSQTSKAIQKLIRDGRRLEQRLGVLYDPNGAIVENLDATCVAQSKPSQTGGETE